MRYLLLLTGLVFICLLTVLNSCKKTSSEFNTTTPGLTATINGQTAKYLVPAGLVNYTTLSGYEKDSIYNSIVLVIDTIRSARDTFGRGHNSLTIVNSGVQYSSANNHSAFPGLADVTINGRNITGSFSGTLYATSTDSLVVANGIISTTY